MAGKWVACDLEDEYFGDDRKIQRQERKKKKAKDRSKFKKTDWEKHQKKSSFSEDASLLRGRVLSITSQGILVDCDGSFFTCSLRGALKKERLLNKTLVTVGDFVRFEKTSEDEGSIAHVEPRSSLLSRADNLSRKKRQLIAANIDLVLITASVVLPELKPTLVDRYIIAAKKGGMEPIIVVNKIDLLEDEANQAQKELFEEFKRAYEKAGIPIISVSAETNAGLEELKAYMKGKASVFSGQSGVGKSSLINKLTSLALKTGAPVERTKKGAHTTTTASLIPLEFGGFCIDTPGVGSFGLFDLQPEEIESYFSEIHEFGKGCKFPDCAHLHEESCAVIQAVEEGKISSLRYQSYLALRERAGEEHLRR